MQVGVFIDEIAAVSSQGLEFEVEFGPDRLEESEAELGGAEDGGDVGVVGFVVGIGRLSELARSVRVHEPGFELGELASALEVAVVGAGHFDCDDEIANVVLLALRANASDGMLELGSGVFDHGGRQKDLAVEIEEGELGAELGDIDADDAEVFGPDGLNAGRERTMRLGDAIGFAGTTHEKTP